MEKWLNIKKKKKKNGQFSFLLTFCNYHTLWFQILKNWPTLMSTVLWFKYASIAIMTYFTNTACTFYSTVQYVFYVRCGHQTIFSNIAISSSTVTVQCVHCTVSSFSLHPPTLISLAVAIYGSRFDTFFPPAFMRPVSRGWVNTQQFSNFQMTVLVILNIFR